MVGGRGSRPLQLPPDSVTLGSVPKRVLDVKLSVHTQPRTAPAHSKGPTQVNSAVPSGLLPAALSLCLIPPAVSFCLHPWGSLSLSPGVCLCRCPCPFLIHADCSCQDLGSRAQAVTTGAARVCSHRPPERRCCAETPSILWAGKLGLTPWAATAAFSPPALLCTVHSFRDGGGCWDHESLLPWPHLGSGQGRAPWRRHSWMDPSHGHRACFTLLPPAGAQVEKALSQVWEARALWLTERPT